MVSIYFFFRPSTKNTSDGSLYVRIIYRRKVRQWSLNCNVESWEWDERKQEVVYPRNNRMRKEYLRKISDQLATHIYTLQTIVDELERSGECFGVAEIQRAYLLREDIRSLRGYAGKLAMEKEHVEKERTGRAYRMAAKALQQFSGEELVLTEISPALLKSFETSMKKSGLRPNTISFYMRLLRTICNKAHREGILVDPPARLFKDVFTGYASTPKRALTGKDLSLLFEVNIPDLMSRKAVNRMAHYAMEGVYIAWRLFFFSFHACGMCFVDMANLRKESISDDVLTYRRKKTGRLVEISLTPPMIAIINDFAVETENSPYIFPLLRENGKSLRRQYESAERTYNRRLKRLALLAGIEGRLSSHTARHTWASIGKNKLFPLGVLSACLGHSSEKTTNIYLAAFNREILAEANRVITQEYIYLPSPDSENFQRYMDETLNMD
jgi:integrase